MIGQIIEAIEEYDDIPDIPQLDLPEEDGELLETAWHRNQMNLLIDVVRQRWADRQDFFTGGNMFIYYSLQQVKNKDYKGPDFFLVKGIESGHSRPKWVVWEEDGRYPNLIVELMSPSTRREDLVHKKVLYEHTFHTADYFCYDPDEQRVYGWRLVGDVYEPIMPDENGRFWSSQLDAWMGKWEGVYQKEEGVWLRPFDEDGRLWPTAAEAQWQRAEAERQRAEAEWQRAEAERQRAETERQRAETERQRAETERQRAEAEHQRAEKAEAELAELWARLAQQEK